MSRAAAPPGLPPWSDYPAFVRRHRALLGALVAVGLLAGFGWSLGRPPSYSATASVVLTPVPKYVTASTIELVAPAVTIDTDAQLLRSPPVLGAVADAAGVPVGSAAEHIGVTASPRTRVLHVTVSASSPGAAAAGADAAVAALGEVRREVLGSLADDQVRRLQGLVREHEQDLASTRADEVVVPAYDDLTAQLLELDAGLAQLEEGRDRPLEAITPAEAPQRADYANTEVPLVSGAMLGLLVGCLAGAASDRAGRRAGATSSTDPRRGGLPRVLDQNQDHRHVA